MDDGTHGRTAALRVDQTGFACLQALEISENLPRPIENRSSGTDHSNR